MFDHRDHQLPYHVFDTLEMGRYTPELVDMSHLHVHDAAIAHEFNDSNDTCDVEANATRVATVSLGWTHSLFVTRTGRVATCGTNTAGVNT